MTSASISFLMVIQNVRHETDLSEGGHCITCNLTSASISFLMVRQCVHEMDLSEGGHCITWNLTSASISFLMVIQCVHEINGPFRKGSLCNLQRDFC